ncbi:MAG: hypothetical protein HY922_17660 [Elusimicrobia bacterium]|nr:hypothetical protein [Elusimicrobiota bacterium]
MSFSEILGQPRALGRIRSLLRSRRLPPALLFMGPEGTGKKKAALELAKALNCGGSGAAVLEGAGSSPLAGEGESQGDDSCGLCPSCIQANKGVSPDIQLIDAQYQAMLKFTDEEDGEEKKQDLPTLIAKHKLIHIKTIRYAMASLTQSSFSGGWKTAIVEDAHDLVPAAANAMLKALEEPPPRTLWILVTRQDERLPATIRSRCHKVRFGLLPQAAVMEVLGSMGREGPPAQRAAELCNGSLSRALTLLEGRCPDPDEWLGDPLGPFRIADALPRELHLSRPLVEEHFIRMSDRLRGAYASARARSALREFAALRRALASNIDPRLALTAAALTLQSIPSSERP